MDGRRRDTWVRGVRLASYAVGPAGGTRVVVVPGLCVSSYLWPACDALARAGFRAELVEPPGWPRSGRPRPEPTDLAGLAGWLADWLAAREHSDVLLVGQSVGTQLAAHCAAQAPERVRAVVLQGPVFDPAYRSVLRGLGRWLAHMPRTSRAGRAGGAGVGDGRTIAGRPGAAAVAGGPARGHRRQSRCAGAGGRR
jgi:pimeloyl-ACP methyl ester carboxylesterase